MTHNRLVQLLAVACMILSLIGAGLIAPRIEEPRFKARMILGDQVAQTLPPHMAFMTVMLSVVRGIAVDILWYRAESLQQEGKFYEINQLCELIASLQPYFEEVWVFHSWNMAFNISVLTKTPDERWDWVNKGIILLRDQGIQLNPKSATMYKELDWLFYFKIGQYSDDFNWYYKAKLALEWQQLLGAQAEGLTTDQAADQFAKVADAPETLAQVESAHPHVAQLVEKLKTIGFTTDERLALQVGLINMYVLSPAAAFYGFTLQHPIDFVSAPLCAVMADPQFTDDFEPLVNHLRRRVLVEHYKMDPQFMLKLMHEYGPLDWRHPDSHSLYWASEGTRVSEAEGKRVGAPRDKDIELLNTYRGTVHSIQDLMFRGRMTFDPLTNPPRMDFMPDPRFIPAYDKAFDFANDYMDEFEARKIGFGGAQDNFAQGRSNFLQTAVQFCYLYGDKGQAQFYYDKLRKLYAKKFGGPTRYQKTLEDFVHENLLHDLDTYYITQQFIQSMIINGIKHGLVPGRGEVFARFIDLARAAHEKWNKGREIIRNGENVPRSRQKLLPFDQMVAEVFVDYMNTAGMPSITRAELWQAAPDELRRRVFDRLQAGVRKAAAAEKLDPMKVFPEPPGMDQYRKLHPIQPAQMEAAPPDSSKSIIHSERY